MKPIFNRVAKTLKEENENSVIAFVDCTKETKLNSRFKIKGFPTVKYFKVCFFLFFPIKNAFFLIEKNSQDGQFAWDYNERKEEKILEFLKKYFCSIKKYNFSN